MFSKLNKLNSGLIKHYVKLDTIIENYLIKVTIREIECL